MIGIEEKKAVIDLFPFMGQNPVVFDVGSNKGHWADVVLEEFGDKCELHLFEPNKKMLSFSEIKYEYKTNVFYHNVGLLNEDGTKQFFFFENYNNEISSFYNGGKDWDGLPLNTGKVEVKRGSTILEQLKIPYVDYLKIDCEGADFETLLGFSCHFEEDRIGIVQIEYSEHWKRGTNYFGRLIEYCNKYGFKIYKYIENNFWEVTEENPPYDNYFITKFEIHNHSVGGWNGEFIINTAGLPKFDLCLEVGGFEGMTTKYICENMLNEGGRVNVVDPMMDVYVKGDTAHPYFRNQYQRFLRNTRGLNVNLHRGNSEDMLPTLNALRHDFIFIDGNHYGENPYIDGCWAMAITKVGGYILFDDYTWRNETNVAIDKFLNEFAGSIEVITKEYQVLIQKKANQYNQLTQSYYL